MSDWKFAQQADAEELALLHHFSFKKYQNGAEIPFVITVREFVTAPKGQFSRFFAQADKEVNQKAGAILRNGGRIINMSSVSGQLGLFGQANYSSSKAAIIALTKVSAREFARQNITVNAIAPGFLYTPMVAPFLTEATRELRRRAAPLGTEGTAWDVAWAAVFLASEEARWITGVVLPVDAGLLATTPLSTLPNLRQV